MRVIERKCAVCGNPIEIEVAEDGTYEGAAYFGELFPDSDREYWECPDCLAADDGG